MKKRTIIPASRLTPDQIVLVLSRMVPDAWQWNDSEQPDGSWIEPYHVLMRDDMEQVLAETAMPYAIQQRNVWLASGRRLC